MVKEDLVLGLSSTGKVVTLEGTPSEVKWAFLAWAKWAFPEVQRSIKKRKVDLWGVETLIADLRNGRPYSVRFDYGGTRPSKAYRTGAFLGAFHRLGEKVRLRATVICREGKDPYAMAYTLLTYGQIFPFKYYPPGDLDLLARAIVYPEKARLMEELDMRRENLELLKDRLPPSLAKPLAKVGPIQLKNLKVWDGVALYREGDTRWLVFDGRAHRLDPSDWPLVRRILRKRGYTHLEKARMAMLMVRMAK